MADIVDGVYLVNSLDDFNGCTELSGKDFIASLDDLCADEVIGAFLTYKELAQVDKVYGVH